MRRELGLRPGEFGAPMDVLWFRLPRRPDDAEGCRCASAPAASSSASTAATTGSRATSCPRAATTRVARPGWTRSGQHRARWPRGWATASPSSSTWDEVKLLTVQVEPAAPVARARRPAHRRRGTRDVPGRWRRHQPRRPGRGGDRPDARAGWPTAPSPPPTCRRWPDGGCSRPAHPDGALSANAGWSIRRCAPPGRSTRPGCCDSWPACRGCRAYRRGWWATAPVPSTSRCRARPGSHQRPQPVVRAAMAVGPPG